VLPIGVEIRKAIKRDVPELLKGWKAFIEEHAGIRDPRHDRESRVLFRFRKGKESIQRKTLEKLIRARKAAVFVAEADGRIIGHIIAEMISHRPIYVHDREAYVSEIFVRKPFRKKGIGRMLFKEAEAWAKSKGAHSMGLNVHIRNRKAFSMYKRMGFWEHNYKMAKII
jgi:GNAT superfamily N-acetyltransferase